MRMRLPFCIFTGHSTLHTLNNQIKLISLRPIKIIIFQICISLRNGNELFKVSIFKHVHAKHRNYFKCNLQLNRFVSQPLVVRLIMEVRQSTLLRSNSVGQLFCVFVAGAAAAVEINVKIRKHEKSQVRLKDLNSLSMQCGRILGIQRIWFDLLPLIWMCMLYGSDWLTHSWCSCFCIFLPNGNELVTMSVYICGCCCTRLRCEICVGCVYVRREQPSDRFALQRSDNRIGNKVSEICG